MSYEVEYVRNIYLIFKKQILYNKEKHEKYNVYLIEHKKKLHKRSGEVIAYLT